MLEAFPQPVLKYSFLLRLRYIPKACDYRDLGCVPRAAELVNKSDKLVVDCLGAVIVHAVDEYDANNFGMGADGLDTPDDLLEDGSLLSLSKPGVSMI